MNKNKKLSDITVKEFEELLKNTIPKLYFTQTQPYWYFPNEVGDYPPINTNNDVVRCSNHTEVLNDRN